MLPSDSQSGNYMLHFTRNIVCELIETLRHSANFLKEYFLLVSNVARTFEPCLTEIPFFKYFKNMCNI